MMHDYATGPIPDVPPASDSPARTEGLRFLVEGGGLAEVDGFVELGVDGSLVGYSRSLLEVYGVSDEEREELAGIGDALAHQRALTAMISRRVADPPAGPAPHRPTPASETTFEDVPLLGGRVVERYGVPLRRADGAVAGRLFVVRDVTARRRAEQELRTRAIQHEAMAELGARALVETDLDALLPAAVRRAATALGAGCEVHLLAADAGGRLAAWAASDDGPGRCDLVGERPEAAAAGPALRVPVRGRSGPWGVLCAHWPGAHEPTRDEAHFLETLASFLSAAFARHGAERALAEREREARAVFEHALDALVTLDDDGRVAGANPAARRLLSPGPNGDRSAWDTFEAEIRQRWSTLRTAGRTGGELEVRATGGSRRQIEWSAIAWILPGRHLAVLRDVTESRLAQARIAHDERLASIGTLAGGIAHEINNPLAGLFASLSFVAEQVAPLLPPGDDGREVAEALEDGRTAAERMRDVIRDLQVFSGLDDGALAVVDVLGVVDTALRAAEGELRRRARVVRDLAEVPRVRASEGRLARVVLKLLVNAAQAIAAGAPDENEIRVSSRLAADGRVAIEVADTGCGIAPEHLSRVFDPFFTTRPIGGGSGLGLPVCLGVVRSLGGTIEVESEVGRGTRFRVLLPAA